MYEQHKQPIASKGVFYRRIINNLIVAFAIIGISLVIGVLGYHYTEDIPWLDSVHQASMILSGMGPIITDFHTNGGKIFSSAYALFSGVVFITNLGIILAPAAHRIFHRLHLQEK